MLNLPSTVSVNRYLPKRKNKDRQTYFSLYYQKHREKLLTKRKTRYLNQKSLLWSNFFTCKKPWCYTCIQAGTKETEYKFCGENCSVKYWLTIYAKICGRKEKERDLKEREKVKKERKSVEQFSPHTRVDIFNSPHAPAGRLHARVKNSFFLFNIDRGEENKQERRKRKDQAWRRLATKGKIAQTSGYNLPNYQEKRSIEGLLKQYGEYSYLTGKPLGNYYLSTLDIDLRKVEFPEKMVAKLEKIVDCLLNSLRVSYDKTKKGLHVDILTPEPLPNEIIYYQGWGKTWNVGSIQSKGKYVVGEDKEKEFINRGKWYWKADRNEEIRAKLTKFLFIVGKRQSEAKEVVNSTPNFKKINWIAQQIKRAIQAKILNIRKTGLTDLIKIFYLNQKTQKTGYFLLNTYQRAEALPSLSVGSVRSMLLVSGTKHDFFSRMRLRTSILSPVYAG